MTHEDLRKGQMAHCVQGRSHSFVPFPWKLSGGKREKVCSIRYIPRSEPSPRPWSARQTSTSAASASSLTFSSSTNRAAAEANVRSSRLRARRNAARPLRQVRKLVEPPPRATEVEDHAAGGGGVVEGLREGAEGRLEEDACQHGGGAGKMEVWVLRKEGLG
ncbi:hypothetical protein B0H12DRAFT_433588 [Mycena haematopus]|nr:hypothetical protein B0H12DRAFT_433588 [Mycena haematopus]